MSIDTKEPQTFEEWLEAEGMFDPPPETVFAAAQASTKAHYEPIIEERDKDFEIERADHGDALRSVDDLNATIKAQAEEIERLKARVIRITTNMRTAVDDGGRPLIDLIGELEALAETVEEPSICSACLGTGYVGNASGESVMLVSPFENPSTCSQCRGTGAQPPEEPLIDLMLDGEPADMIGAYTGADAPIEEVQR